MLHLLLQRECEAFGKEYAGRLMNTVKMKDGTWEKLPSPLAVIIFATYSLHSFLQLEPVLLLAIVLDSASGNCTMYGIHL